MSKMIQQAENTLMLLNSALSCTIYYKDNKQTAFIVKHKKHWYEK